MAKLPCVRRCSAKPTPVPAPSRGIRTAVRSSSGRRAVWCRPVNHWLAGMVRVPAALASSISASMARPARPFGRWVRPGDTAGERATYPYRRMSDVPGGQSTQPPERVSAAVRGPPAALRPGGALAEPALLKLAVPDERADLHPAVRDLQLSELAQLVDVHDHLGAGPAEMQSISRLWPPARTAA